MDSKLGRFRLPPWATQGDIIMGLGASHPGGCYFFFNAEINAKSVEQLLYVVINALREGFTQITLCISSTGGDADSAIYAFNTLRSLPVRVNTHNVDGVQSAAITLFLAGAARTANPGSYFFFHQSAVGFDRSRLTASYLNERVKIAKRHDERAAQIIAKETGRAVKRIYDWQRTEVYMSIQQALTEGIVHAERALTIPADAWVQHVLV